MSFMLRLAAAGLLLSAANAVVAQTPAQRVPYTAWSREEADARGMTMTEQESLSAWRQANAMIERGEFKEALPLYVKVAIHCEQREASGRRAWGSCAIFWETVRDMAWRGGDASMARMAQERLNSVNLRPTDRIDPRLDLVWRFVDGAWVSAEERAAIRAYSLEMIGKETKCSDTGLMTAAIILLDLSDGEADKARQRLTAFLACRDISDLAVSYEYLQMASRLDLNGQFELGEMAWLASISFYDKGRKLRTPHQADQALFISSVHGLILNQLRQGRGEPRRYFALIHRMYYTAGFPRDMREIRHLEIGALSYAAAEDGARTARALFLEAAGVYLARQAQLQKAEAVAAYERRQAASLFKAAVGNGWNLAAGRREAKLVSPITSFPSGPVSLP